MPPDRESFHLGTAKLAYMHNQLTLEELEQSIEHVLRGGTLTATGRIPEWATVIRTTIESPYANAN